MSETARREIRSMLEVLDSAREDCEVAIAVRIERDVVALQLPETLDCSGTIALVELVGAAVRCRSTVAIDLAGRGAMGAPPAFTADQRDPDASLPGPWVTGAGIVRLRTPSGGCWTFDLNRHRLLRSDATVDVRFVDSGAWSPIDVLWTGATRTAVLLGDGSYVSTPAGWVTRTPAVPAPGRAA